MQRVFVLDKNKKPLMPCHPARARQLLRKGRAAVFRHYPFTIILKDRETGNTQDVRIKIDPGSKYTGVALVAEFKRGKRVVWGAVIEHRGDKIHRALEKRRAVRRSRRTRKTRYREPRFLNRRRSEGWLPPSLESRVLNISTWVRRLLKLCPITAISMELVRFDIQKLQNPEISGVEYQRGELFGYEVREYLLEKWGHKCAYCGATNVPLEIEHIIPKSRGGTDRISNLTLACRKCNLAKGNKTAAEFGYPEIQEQAKKPLRDAAAINSTRWKLYDKLKKFNLPIECGSGGRTKYNRVKQGHPKEHWIDAACVGKSGENIFIIRDGVIYTPDLTSALAGITRDTIFTLASDLGYKIIEKRITRDEVYCADEAFFTGTAAEVTPIRELDNRPIGNGTRGPITEQLQTLYFDCVYGRNDKYKKWIAKGVCQ